MEVFVSNFKRPRLQLKLKFSLHQIWNVSLVFLTVTYMGWNFDFKLCFTGAQPAKGAKSVKGKKNSAAALP